MRKESEEAIRWMVDYMQKTTVWETNEEYMKIMTQFFEKFNEEHHLTTKEWISGFFAKIDYNPKSLGFIPSIHRLECLQAMVNARKGVIRRDECSVVLREAPAFILTILEKNDQFKFNQDTIDTLCFEALRQDINIPKIEKILSKMTDKAIFLIMRENWRIVKFLNDEHADKILSDKNINKDNISKNTMDDLCRNAIKADWTEIKYASDSVIEGLSSTNLCEAIQSSRRVMESFSDIPIKFRTREVCLKHIRQEAVISLMSKETERPTSFTKEDYAKCCEEYIKQPMTWLYDIPFEHRTPAVCLTAAKKDHLSIRFIPESKSKPSEYRESFIEAMKLSKQALKHIEYDVLFDIKDEVRELLFKSTNAPAEKNKNLSKQDCVFFCSNMQKPEIVKSLFKLYPQDMLKVLDINSLSAFEELLKENKLLASMAASTKEVQHIVFNQADDTFLKEISVHHPEVVKPLSQDSRINYKLAKITGLSALGDQCIELLIMGSLNKQQPLQNHNMRPEGMEKFVAMFTADGLKEWLINSENKENMSEETALKRLYNTIAGEKNEILSKEEEGRLSSFFNEKAKDFLNLVLKAINVDELNDEMRILFGNDELIFTQLDFKILKKYAELLTPTEGPRNKNAATFLVEDILYKIAANQDGIFPELTYNEIFEEWELNVEGKKEPISLLLKHANLLHLELKDDAIIEIARKYGKELGLNEIELTLDNIFNTIIKRYTANDYYSSTIKYKFYEIMNQFSRGDLSQGKPVKADVFIYTCLLSIAMNRRISLLEEPTKTGERAPGFYRGYLTRKEVLDDKTLTERRLGEQELKQLTSTCKPKGSFDKRNSKFTIFYNSPPIQDLTEISKHPAEAEVLLTSGYTAVYLPESDNKTIHAVLRTKPEKREKSYFTDLSLRVAYERYLKKQFSETADDIKINNVTIARPNHGLAHTYRVMQYSDYVIEYFKNHAADTKFRDFCENISDKERQFIKIALAFSVTGRESEASWSKGKELYYKFRKNSAENFEKFCEDNALFETVEINGEKKVTKKMIERYKDLVLHLNEPSKFKLDETNPTRHFVEIIMSFSHTLDLPRCYVIPQYCKSMEQYAGIIERSEYQKHDLNELEKFACTYIEEMGDTLLFNKSSTGEFRSVSLKYQEPFDLYSTSIKQCERFTCSYSIQFKGKSPPQVPQPSFDNSTPTFPLK